MIAAREGGHGRKFCVYFLDVVKKVSSHELCLARFFSHHICWILTFVCAIRFSSFFFWCSCQILIYLENPTCSHFCFAIYIILFSLFGCWRKNCRPMLSSTFNSLNFAEVLITQWFELVLSSIELDECCSCSCFHVCVLDISQHFNLLLRRPLVVPRGEVWVEVGSLEKSIKFSARLKHHQLW